MRQVPKTLKFTLKSNRKKIMWNGIRITVEQQEANSARQT